MFDRLPRGKPPFSFQVEPFQVVHEESIFDGPEDHADALGVRGTGVVFVKGLGMPAVPLHVHLQDEFLCGNDITLRPCGSN